MTGPETPLPNAYLRQLIEGIVAVLGNSVLQAALTRAGLTQRRNSLPPNDLELDATMEEYSQLLEALESMTGRGSRSALRRVGQASFNWTLEQLRPPDPVSRLALRSRPVGLRQGVVLKAIGAGMEEMILGSKVSVGREGSRRIYQDSLSVAACCRDSETPVCFVYAGYLEQAMAYASDRPVTRFRATETLCRACGQDDCRFEIEELLE